LNESLACKNGQIKHVRDTKEVISQNVTSFRKQDGKEVFRKDKVFFDGSRLVEESFIDGADGDIEYGGNVPIVTANYVGQQTQDKLKEVMLQPMYDPDGNPYIQIWSPS
jgi:hypothetical protein